MGVDGSFNFILNEIVNFGVCFVYYEIMVI